MTLIDLIALGAIVTAVLWLTLVGFVVVRKHRRDLRERGSGKRRSRNRDAVVHLDDEAIWTIVREVVASPEAQVDLLATLDDPGLAECPGTALLRSTAIDARISVWLERQARSRDPVERGRAVLLAGRMKLPEAVAIAVPLLDDEDSDVRLAACAALEDAHSELAARALIDAIGVSGLPTPRLIERLGSAWTQGVVLRALREPRPSEAKVALIRALGLAGDAGATPSLLAFLEDGDEEQRTNAARALGEVRADEAVDPLCAAMDDESQHVRAQAARALGRIGDAAAVSHLEPCLDDRAWWVRANAGNALRSLGPEGLAALRRVERDSSDRFARDRARESLALAEIEVKAIA